MTRDADEVIDLRDVTAFDSDAAGTIYAVQRQEEGQICIVVIDGRQEVLEAQQRQGSLQAPVHITSPIAMYILHTQSATDFDVRGLQIAPSGRYLLLHGTSYQDASIIKMAVVDLHGAQPAPVGPHGRSGASHSARQKVCRLHPVDPVLFSSRPGLVLNQASWHPHSEEHLVVLTSDNRVRLYRVTHSLAIAEQTLHVILSTGALPQRYGLGAASGSPGPGGTAGEAQASGDVVAFAFGPSVGWGIFALLLLAVDGQVYVLGPVAPFGLRCTSALLERLSQETAAAAEWLEAVFGSDAVQDPSSKNRWQVLPHVVDVSPAVVGPLNARSRQEAPMRARATSLLVSHTLAVTAAIAGDASAPSSVSTAVVGSMDGRLLAYAVAGPWAPAWCDSAPQYMSATGTAAAAPSAVRYKCTLRVGSSGSGPGKFCGSADAEVMPPGMALLDVVELPSALSSGCATGTTGAASDSDVEEDAYDEDDVSVVVAAARRAMSVHVQPGVSGSTVVVAGGGAVAATTVWVCQRSLGCWRVTLPWSGVLAQWLVDAASASPALPAELPPPVVTCVYDARAAAQGAVTPAARTTAVGNAAAIGSCLLLNPLLGGGLLMLTAAGVLHYYQPAGTASLILEQQQMAAAAVSPHALQKQQQPGAQASAAVGKTSPWTSPEERNAQVEAHIKSVYGKLIVPPLDRKLPEPPTGVPKPLTVAVPEGLRHLTGCIAALRDKHMAFLHGAAVDLQGRADALRSEAGKHAAAVTELADLAVALENRQEELEARLSRVKLLHDNLVERAGLLASLHWSLPRALSHAEIVAREELSGADARVKTLQSQWTIMAARARRLCEQRRGSGAGMAGIRVANVPEAQLEKVQSAVLAHYSGLAAARTALVALERAAAGAIVEQTAEQLDKDLGLGGLGLDMMTSAKLGPGRRPRVA